ncbi:YibE/F family protein [Arcanobacterium haemolyticum]|nr:YibE/F family protein [Arcanobacterium haemolyticum]
MSHHHTVQLPQSERRKVARRLAALVVPLALITLVSLVAFWPRGEGLQGSIPIDAPGVERVIGEIASIGQIDETGQTPVTMIVDGTEVAVHVPHDIVAHGLDVGDRIRAIFNPSAMGTSAAYVFSDFVRTVPLAVLLGAYALAVLVVARVKGLMALVGLGTCLGVVGVFILPALSAGSPPVPVMLTGAGTMMFASIYVAHGISIRTTSALLGTFVGILITLAVAAWATNSLELTGTTTDDSLVLMGDIPGLDMRALLLCGMLLAGLGALNDVTITQVSTVWELHHANPLLPRRRLFAQGMAVGRDHIASTVYTLAFAYVGTSLPMLMAASLMQRPFVDLLQLSQIAEEIARTLTASIGLILAIPVTTAIAAMLAPVAPGPLVGDEQGTEH